MCKRLFTGSRKYQEDNPDIQQANQQKWKPLAPRDNAGEAERPTVVAFGSALFGGLRGNVPSPTKVFRKALLNYVKSIRRNRPNSRKYVVMIDEYLTSQICPRCHLRSTTNERDYANFKIHPVSAATPVTLDGTEIIWQVSICAQSSCIWLPTTTTGRESFSELKQYYVLHNSKTPLIYG
ncbi:hypothetical protein BD408DRAFT_443064 [Parasitella parasitica]|nr:hypothetical protein BD408DRAFT_443064 [Parasitella parasitica]